MWRKILKLPLDYWQGKLPLLPSFAIGLIGLRALISALGGLPWFAVDLVVWIWQVVGAGRALMHAQTDRPDLIGKIAGITAIAATLPFMALPHLDRLAQDVPLTPTPAPENGLRLIATKVALDGDIGFPMFTALEQALLDNPELERVVLNSNGGRIFAARAIAQLVRDRGLTTEVTATCSSACTLIFLAGDQRILGPDARLGFHGYSQNVYVQSVAPDDEEAKDRATLLATGIDAAFLDRAFATSPQDMWFPDRATLRAAGVVTPP
ncbi:MAG TPA: hypothetical protein ENK28_00040 [Aliiroseovarius sp.]|nr:hypothetical protein [Aliiroseovarius sp.]